MCQKKTFKVGCTLVLPLRTALAFLVRMEAGGGPDMSRVVLNLFMPFLGSPAQNIRCEAADERVKKGSMKSSSHAESSDGAQREERERGRAREWRQGKG